MAIEFDCGRCGKLLRAPDGSEGRKCRCPQCEFVATVPGASVPAPLSAPATEIPRPAPRGKGRLVGVLVALLVLIGGGISYAMYAAGAKRAAGRATLARQVEGGLAAARRQAEQFDFDTAMKLLQTLATAVDESPYADVRLHEALSADVDAAIEEIGNAHRRFREKRAAGWVIFEGALMPPAQRGEILAEREQRRLEEERRRREEERQRREAERQARIEALKPQAYRMSQEFVKQKLKAPSSARFPAYESSDVLVVYSEESSKYLVRAWVEAKNPFGVYLRVDYVCSLWPTDNDMWESDVTHLEES